jgi:hypothetical protein
MHLPKSSKFWIAFLSTGCCLLLLCHPAWSQAGGAAQDCGNLTAPSPTAPAAAAAAPPPSQAEPAKDVYPRWSVAGQWHVTHPEWTNVITLRADGSIVSPDPNLVGKWILSADGGKPMIVFHWDLYGTDSVSMVTPDHFRGQVSHGFMDMQRGDAPEKSIAEAKNGDGQLIVGQWLVTHPEWTNVITLRADGSIISPDPNLVGKWILTANGGTPMLVFHWDLYGTDSVSMVTPGHFRGQVSHGSFMDMQRGDAPEKSIAEAKTFNRKVQIPLLTPSSEVRGE